MPRVPSFFKGLINLRGKIISVIDLRAKLNLPIEKNKEKKTSIVISEINNYTIGSIVDNVSDVIGYDEKQIQERVHIQSKVKQDFLSGVARSSDRSIILLLDFEKIFSEEEMSLIKKRNH